MQQQPVRVTVVPAKRVRNPQAHNPTNWVWRPNNGPLQRELQTLFERDPDTGGYKVRDK